MPENMILLGKRIRHLRKARSMTQEELAVASDIGVKYLSRIERGDTNVTVRLLDRIAAALNVETADLLLSNRNAAGRNWNRNCIR